MSVIVTIVVFCDSRRRERRAETFKAINELYEFYYKIGEFDIDKNYKKSTWFVSKIDRFAASYLEKMYDKKLVKDRVASYLKRLYYEKGMRELIIQRRKQFNREEYYDSIEKMLREFI